MNQSTDNIEFSYTNWRAGFLRVTLIGACIFGLVALIPGVTTAAEPIYSAIYVGLYLALLLVTFINFPHSIKAGLFIALVFLLGVSGLLETGIWGDSRLFMLGAITMASLLFSWKAGWVVTSLTMLSYLVSGWLVLSGSMTISNPDVPEGGIEIWASGSTAVMLLAVLIINGIRLTQDEFGKAEHRSQTVLEVLRNEKFTLEQRVEDRTQDLANANRINEHRARMFQAIAQVTRAIISTQNLQDLLPQITQAISQYFGFYHIGIFLIDPNREYAVLSASNSEGGQRMLDRNHKLRIGQVGIVGYVAGTAKPRIALDTGADARYFTNPDLPETRSEMALPIIQTGGQVIGVLDIQSTEPNAFKHEDIEILITLADQVSVAIANARLYEEIQKNLIESEMHYRHELQAGWRKFANMQQIAGVRRIGANTNIYTESMELPGAEEVINSGFAHFKIGNNSQMTIPIKLRGETVGILNVKTAEKRRWTEDEMDIITAIVERAALSIENARLLVESQKSAEKERVIGEISTKIGSLNNLESLLQSTIQELGNTLPDIDIAIQIKNNQETE
jgi:GAF domain-containing protein